MAIILEKKGRWETLNILLTSGLLRVKLILKDVWGLKVLEDLVPLLKMV